MMKTPCVVLTKPFFFVMLVNVRATTKRNKHFDSVLVVLMEHEILFLHGIKYRINLKCIKKTLGSKTITGGVYYLEHFSE